MHSTPFSAMVDGTSSHVRVTTAVGIEHWWRRDQVGYVVTAHIPRTGHMVGWHTLLSRTNIMNTKFSILVDHNALYQYPFLDKLQKRFYPISSLNEIINALENRQEGLRVELVYNVLKLFLINANRDSNNDYLGLPKIEGQLKEICDIVREATSFGNHGGIDPRTQRFYSRKSSILQGSNLSDDALLAPNCLSSRGERKRHPLDLVSTEEVAKRRELADRRWKEQKKQQRKRSNETNTKKIENAKNFFDRR